MWKLIFKQQVVRLNRLSISPSYLYIYTHLHRQYIYMSLSVSILSLLFFLSKAYTTHPHDKELVADMVYDTINLTPGPSLWLYESSRPASKHSFRNEWHWEQRHRINVTWGRIAPLSNGRSRVDLYECLLCVQRASDSRAKRHDFIWQREKWPWRRTWLSLVAPLHEGVPHRFWSVMEKQQGHV